MNVWYSVDLGDAISASVSLVQLQEQLSILYEQAGKPQDMLAIYRQESTGLHCHTQVYLTEAFQQAAMLADARRCHPPSFVGADFLAGRGH